VLILAFDTSGFAGSVALLDGPRLLAETTLDAQRRSAQTLAPAIAGLLKSQQIEPGQISLVATTIGPGSFTGLRVGVTSAKTFAYAVGANVIGVSTLEAIAHGVPGELLSGGAGEIHAVLDAQRKELFVGRFRSKAGAVIRLESDRIVAAETWLAGLPAGTVVTGSGLARVADRLPCGIVVVTPEFREVKASCVGQLAWRDYNAGRRDNLWKLAPVYLRPSYAEEKAAKMQIPSAEKDLMR
jgi:tRNA threonylcarbamoyladenosine biosynthesis protein TsaB